jgi:hypothetical protein
MKGSSAGGRTKTGVLTEGRATEQQGSKAEVQKI